MPRTITVLSLVVVLLWCGVEWSQEPTRPRTGSTRSRPGSPGQADFGPFSLQPPKGWETVRPPGSMGMRKAQYILPAAEEGTERGQCIVYYFGAAGAGSVEQNLQRWRRQFLKPDGMSDAEHLTIHKKSIDGLAVTLLEIHGTYLGSQMGQGTAPPRKDRHMMITAVVETSGGPYYVKITAPEKTLEHWKKACYKMIDDLKARKKS
ncbi:MAG: hypothetical protein V3T77_00535 [Planctomycetota bacterium]